MLSCGKVDSFGVPRSRGQGSETSQNRLKAELQAKINPAIHRDLREIDAIVGDLIQFFSQRSVQVVLLSEYGITNVETPVHLNRFFRKQGWRPADKKD